MTRTRALALTALVTGASAAAYARWGRPWQERWGATDEEIALALPATNSSRSPPQR